MTFQDAIKLFVTTPFTPKKSWKDYNDMLDIESKMPGYVLLMFLFWYFVVYSQLYFPDVWYGGALVYIFMMAPVLINVYGLMYTTQIASNFVLKDRFEWRFCVALVSFSIFPIFIVFAFSIITGYWHWGLDIVSACWSAVIMYFGIIEVKQVEQSKAITTAVIAHIMIYIFTYIISRYVLSAILFSF